MEEGEREGCTQPHFFRGEDNSYQEYTALQDTL